MITPPQGARSILTQAVGSWRRRARRTSSCSSPSSCSWWCSSVRSRPLGTMHQQCPQTNRPKRHRRARTPDGVSSGLAGTGTGRDVGDRRRARRRRAGCSRRAGRRGEQLAERAHDRGCHPRSRCPVHCRRGCSRRRSAWFSIARGLQQRPASAAARAAGQLAGHQVQVGRRRRAARTRRRSGGRSRRTSRSAAPRR